MQSVKNTGIFNSEISAQGEKIRVVHYLKAIPLCNQNDFVMYRKL